MLWSVLSIHKLFQGLCSFQSRSFLLFAFLLLIKFSSEY